MEPNNDGGTSTNDLSFEEAFTRLEEVVHKLEQGGLSLESATNLFEEGMHLTHRCNELLSKTELQIEHIQTSYGAQMGFLQEQGDGVED